MAKGFLKRLFGDRNDREINRLQKIVQKINALEPQYQALTEAQLREQTATFRARLAEGETLHDLLPEAFAAVREASWRTIGLRHYDVQLIGGMILHEGRVAEMRTGEGKTLVATLPLYLNALTGEGVHLVTPNDYLAKYGVQWMGPIYHMLGMQVSIIQSGGGQPDEASFLYDPDYASDDDRYQHLRPITRHAAYRTDITYGTNNEFGFDYLRDNMVVSLAQCTQRALNFAIIDEVDSILIDEARTPLIISGPAEESSELYQRFAEIVKTLEGTEDEEAEDKDFIIDVRAQNAILTEQGVSKIEQRMGIPEGESLYDPRHAHMLPYLDNALRAWVFYQKDKEYVVRDGEIIIVDQFTGRLMFGRRFSQGLHQAIEAKERVEVQRESYTYATITFQNFFRMYRKLAGMTGTAVTEEEELHKIYELDVIVLPTNVEYRARFGDLDEQDLPAAELNIEFAGVLNGNDAIKVTTYDGPTGERYYRRLDMADLIYQNEKAKFDAVVQEIADCHQAGRPVLVGTTAIETSERLARLLKRRSIPHAVLNAKYHEREAVIIAQAGRPGSVTIATNMAGRGVDILLGGNPEGLARDQLRREEIDLTQINSEAWETVLKLARRGERAPLLENERWAQVLEAQVRECEAARQQVYQLGGLHVIGTERHEARRIDNQLRGRAGRQGDPGSSRFYISLQDELMRRFGGERLQPWMERAGLGDAPLEFNVLSKLIESVQERVEGYNFDIRKHVLEYDNVVNKQREVVYAERRKILSRDDLHDDLMELFSAEVARVIETHISSEAPERWQLEKLIEELRRFAPVPRTLSVADLEGKTPEEIEEQTEIWAEQTYRALNRQLGEALYRSLRQEELSLQQLAESPHPLYQTVAASARETLDTETWERYYAEPLRRLPEPLERQLMALAAEVYRRFRDRELMLRPLDNAWVRHLTDLDILREGIGLRAIGQQNPLVAYQKEAYEAYQIMLDEVQREIVRTIFLVPQQPQPRQRTRSPLSASRRQLQTSGGSSQAGAQSQTFTSAKKLGRNDPCWCGSGKKYKDCHWREDNR